jgi:hypothetical protein
MNNGFLSSTHGNRSSSRLIGIIIIIWSLALCTLVLYWGKAEVVKAAVSAGTLFITIAGPAMVFLFQQKKNEISGTK